MWKIGCPTKHECGYSPHWNYHQILDKPTFWGLNDQTLQSASSTGFYWRDPPFLPSRQRHVLHFDSLLTEDLPLRLLELENQQAIDLKVFPTGLFLGVGESDIILDVKHNFWSKRCQGTWKIFGSPWDDLTEIDVGMRNNDKGEKPGWLVHRCGDRCEMDMSVCRYDLRFQPQRQKHPKTVAQHPSLRGRSMKKNHCPKKGGCRWLCL